MIKTLGLGCAGSVHGARRGRLGPFYGLGGSRRLQVEGTGDLATSNVQRPAVLGAGAGFVLILFGKVRAVSVESHVKP